MMLRQGGSPILALPDRANVKPIPGGRFKTVGIHHFWHSYHGEVVVPSGFVFDGASVPKMLRWFEDKCDRDIFIPSLLHDYLYKTHDRDRETADVWLRDNCEACGMPPAKAQIIYLSVRIGGAFHW